MENTNLLSGVVHGSTIQLDQDAGLPEGQRVTVIVQPEVKRTPGEHVLGEGLLRAFGAWAEDADELDEYLEWNRQQRKIGRREIEP